MKEHMYRAFFKTREGLIVISVSLIYLFIGISSKFSPSIASLFGFIGFISFFMPFVLLFIFFKIGALERDFQSNWFDTAILIFVALVPVITVANLI